LLPKYDILFLFSGVAEINNRRSFWQVRKLQNFSQIKNHDLKIQQPGTIERVESAANSKFWIEKRIQRGSVSKMSGIYWLLFALFTCTAGEMLQCFCMNAMNCRGDLQVVDNCVVGFWGVLDVANYCFYKSQIRLKYSFAYFWVS
jgi:hypothetical protein